MRIEKFISVKNGFIENSFAVTKQIADLPDGRYLLKIEPKNKRSNSQNGYYWACVVPMVLEGLRDMGWNEFEDNDDAHELLKHRFLKKIIPSNHGEAIEKIGSTTKLSTVEFNEYLEKIYAWASEYLNIYIPPPAGQNKLYPA